MTLVAIVVLWIGIAQGSIELAPDQLSELAVYAVAWSPVYLITYLLGGGAEYGLRSWPLPEGE